MTDFEIEQASDAALDFETNQYLDSAFDDPKLTPEDLADIMREEY